MKCPHCGKKIANNSIFCEFCGTKVRQLENVQSAPVVPESTASAEEPKPTKNGCRLMTLLVLGGFILLVVAFVVDAVGGFDSDSNNNWIDTVAVDEQGEIVEESPSKAENVVKETAIKPSKQAKPAWPWSPFAKQKLYNVEFRGGFTWNGMSIVLKDLEIDNMLNKKCYIVIWFRDAKGHYLKTDYSEHQGYGGYACYVTEAKPNYKYCNWKEFTLPTIDTSILDAPSGTKIYITLAVYAAANGKCVGKWKSDGYCHK